MKRHQLAAVLTVFAVVSAAVAAESLSDMFGRVKSEFSQGDYRRSLADLESLDTASQRPGFETDRAKLAPVITFYRAANLAALGHSDEAREEFITFLSYSPNASIASPPFPKTVVDAFQRAQKAAAGRTNALLSAYGTFIVPAGWTLPADDKWAASPVRYLLTSDEKKQYAALTTDSERQAFVDNFWKSLDPTPDTATNEFRSEFERRVAFADARFGDGKMPGRETDRALIFTFLGAPTYSGIGEVSSSEDAMAQLRSGERSGPTAGGSNSTNGFGKLTGAGNNDNLESPDRRGTREGWTYRKNRLPAGVPFQEVRFEFLTKEGYGKGVLQKEPNVLQTLGAAAENARRDKKLN